jgi:mannose-6-phosphate isomerase-like protein (cupin superfamily)
MPKVSRTSASQVNDYGPMVEAREDMEGTAVQFLTANQDLDGTPLMKGLPDDRCSSPHWGYVFKGRITFDCGDHEEVFEAGDAFYLGPGHIPISSEPGTEYLQFSPADDLQVVSDNMKRNMEAMQQAAG